MSEASLIFKLFVHCLRGLALLVSFAMLGGYCFYQLKLADEASRSQVFGVSDSRLAARAMDPIHEIPVKARKEFLGVDPVSLTLEEPLISDVWCEGTTNPEVLSTVGLSNADKIDVIGFEVAGRYYAFAKLGMVSANSFVVSFSCDDQQFVVTFNCLKNLGRVFCVSKGAQLPCGVAGITQNNDLVFVVNGQCFAQNCTDIPFIEVECVSTTLDRWSRQHPTTAFCPMELLCTYRR